LLTPNERGQHAYFPALIICIAFAELLSSLYAGTIADHGLKREELKRYAAKFMKPEYTADRLDILYEFLQIDEYLKNDPLSLARGLERLRVAIHNEEAERREGENWSIAKEYVRSLLHKMT
jgi:hypothetical protein